MPASTPAEALSKAGQCRIDAAICDVRLVDADGFGVAKQLRALPGYHDLPLAFASGDARLANRVDAAKNGATLFLPKPLAPEVLMETLDQLLSRHSGTRPRVLIFDADAAHGRKTADHLGSDGLEAFLITEPAEAIETFHRMRPDLVILDTDLPGISGVDLCRAIRTCQAWRALPVVFFTAHDSAEARLEAFEAGAGAIFRESGAES